MWVFLAEAAKNQVDIKGEKNGNCKKLKIKDNKATKGTTPNNPDSCKIHKP